MNGIALAHLLRLSSPALPVGAFSYSQGLEWAVEANDVSDEQSGGDWIGALLATTMTRFELPLLVRLYRAWKATDLDAAREWNDQFRASRETAELRAETLQMGSALRLALAASGEFDTAQATRLDAINAITFPAAFAFAAEAWGISPEDCALGYAWSWSEGQVTAAMKLVPLGQSAGQRILARLTPEMARAVETAMVLEDDDLSNFAPLYAIASSRHETQYTRLFRS